MADTPQQGTTDQPIASTSHPDLALRMLYDEQTRLRAELEELRGKQNKEAGEKDDQQQKSDEQKSSQPKGESEGGGQQGGDKSDKKADRDKDPKKGDDAKQDDSEKDKDEKEKKPPLKDRVSGWVRQHPLWTVAILIGFLILIVATIWLFIYLGSYEETDDAFVEGHTDPISARINGFVSAVYVENTYRVKKGQILVELDPRDNQIAKDQAAAQVKQAQANVLVQRPNVSITATTQGTQVAVAEQNVASSQANVLATEERQHSAEADLHQAEANEANALREEERYHQLVVKEEVSQELYDQRATTERADAAAVVSRRETADAAAKQVIQAAASLAQAKEQLKQAKENLPRQIAMQRASVAASMAAAQLQQAQAAQAELNFQYTRIYAPEDGIIGNKTIELNSQVTPGQEMFALTQTNDIWVEANFKETEIQKMRPGQSVRIHVDALSLDFDGYVEALPGGTGAVYSLLPPENATGNYVKVVQRLPVRIRFRPGQPGAERLTPGMSVEPKVWVQ